MVRTKPPKDILDRRKEEPPKPPHQAELGTSARTISRISKWLVGGITLVATSLGIVTAYLSLIPRLSASPTQSLDLNNPFSALFIMSNDGPLGINDLDFSCHIYNVGSVLDASVSAITTRMNIRSKRMEPGEKISAPCDPSPLIRVEGQLASADVAVVVRFRPDFVWWTKYRIFRFVTLKSSDGHLYWFPVPATGPPSGPPFSPLGT